MSTLNVSNITDGTTTVDTSYVLNGSAKVRCNWNGTGTPSIRNSLNVSSLTDVATGNQKITYTNNFSAVNYSSTFGGRIASDGFLAFLSGSTNGQYVDACDVITRNLSANADANTVCVECTGDLA
jgi:hypothetical protein